MEILDLYDNNGNKLNEVIIRGDKPDIGKNIMLSVVFIVDSSGKYLVQKTSQEKGGKFSTTGGHVLQGEDGIDTIKRECKEELGININNELKFITRFKYPTKNCIFNVYVWNVDKIDINNLTLQKEEVESIKMMTKEEIKKEIENGMFLESHAYIFKNYMD